MITDPVPSIDVIICVAPSDIHYLFEFCLKSCLQNFTPLATIHVVTPTPSEVRAKLEQCNIPTDRIAVLGDSEVLSRPMMGLPGWLRQQLIKLHADRVCRSRHVCCIGADAVLLRRVTIDDLFEQGSSILYFNRYVLPSNHLHYERRRVEYVSRILQVKPKRSFLLGDFIMELMILDRQHLTGLRDHLARLYGPESFVGIVPAQCDSLLDKVKFGEWTLYAVYILDVMNERVPVRNADCKFMRHIHSNNDLEWFQFDSSVAHFVDKSFDGTRLRRRFAALGIS
jgi:Family of unknown function (DUF6492)